LNDKVWKLEKGIDLIKTNDFENLDDNIYELMDFNENDKLIKE
jgi:hypothetical protein